MSSSSLILYHLNISPPCRLVRVVAKTVGVKLELKTVDIHGGEHLTPEFLKINPQHTVPAIVDGDLSLAESRAICTYLVDKYSRGHSLYPTDVDKRAMVDRYLQFDMGTLCKAMGDYLYPKFREGKELDPAKGEKVNDALRVLETFLGEKKFLLGDEPTVADMAIGVPLSLLDITDFDMSSFGKAWDHYQRVIQLPHWEEVNGSGVQEMRDIMAKMGHAQ